MEKIIMIEWHEARQNDGGIETIAIEKGRFSEDFTQIVGYNGILKGDAVMWRGKSYTVVMVSRLGHIGLSETGALPYTETANIRDLVKV